MKIALSQLNVTVGDMISNKRKMIDSINKAADSGAKLIVFGEWISSGVPWYDLRNLPGFPEKCRLALAPCQKDSDTLSPYAWLNRILYQLIEENKAFAEMNNTPK